MIIYSRSFHVGWFNSVFVLMHSILLIVWLMLPRNGFVNGFTVRQSQHCCIARSNIRNSYMGISKVKLQQQNNPQQQQRFDDVRRIRAEHCCRATQSDERNDALNDADEKERGPSNSNDGAMMFNRRESIIYTISTISLIQAGILGGSANAAVTTNDDTVRSVTSTNRRTIVLTGANSGIGYESCKRLAGEEGTTVVLACRTLEKAKQAIESIRSSDSPVYARLIPAECNLANLQSIRNFVTELKDTNVISLANSNDNNTPKMINVLALNAGISRNVDSKECIRTDDGFELTIGTNHFGHFYLHHLLLPFVKEKIIVTASSVHDPASPGGAQGELATLGTLQGLELQGKDCEMMDGGPFNGDKAYKDSKLCNVLFIRELQRRLDAKQMDITANCFTPGLIVSTGLFRDQNPIFTKIFDFVATDLIKVGETPSWGGAALTYMINSDATSTTKGSYYYSTPGTSSKYGESAFQNTQLFGPTEVSIEAQDNDKARRLWELSEKLLDIKTII